MKKLQYVIYAMLILSNVMGQNVNLNDYVGKYNFEGAPFGYVIVSVENGTLMAEAENVGKGEISASTSADQFTEPNNNAVLVFERDQNKKVIKLKVTAMGQEFIGKIEGNPLDEYTGVYKFPSDSPVFDLKITIKDGQLYGDTEQGSAFLKTTDKKDEYTVVGYDGKATFSRDATGKIVKVLLQIQDMELNGEKK